MKRLILLVSLISALLGISVVYGQMEQQSDTNVSSNSENMSGMRIDGNMSNASGMNTTESPLGGSLSKKQAQSMPGGPLQ